MRVVIWLGVALLLLGSVFIIGLHYGTNKETVACDKVETKNDQATIKQQTHVIGEVKSQGQVTQKTENDYEAIHDNIDYVYADPASVPILNPQPGAAATARLRTIPKSTGCFQTSKEYKLTPKQCDDEEAKANAMWNWAQGQAAIK